MPDTVLITGCSSGIGRALAYAFLRKGFRVIATARRTDTLKDLAIGGASTFALDVNSSQSRQALVADLRAAGIEALDLLIHNAGMAAMGPIIELPEAALRQQFETNVIAPVLLSQDLLGHLRAASNPRVVHIGSVSGILVTPFAGAYCASKAALHAIAEAMQMELAPFGIQVVTVQPGGIESNFGAAATEAVQGWLTPASLYAPIRQGVLARAGASQVKATPTEAFAEDLVEALQAKTLPSRIRLGQGSRMLPFVARWLPARWRRRLLSRRFQLDQLTP